MRNETSAQIADDAASWAARLDRSPLEPDEQLRLDEWMATDVRRVGALMRARAVLARFDALDVLDAFEEPESPQPPQRRRWPAISRAGFALTGWRQDWPPSCSGLAPSSIAPA